MRRHWPFLDSFPEVYNFKLTPHSFWEIRKKAPGLAMQTGGFLLVFYLLSILQL